MAELTANQDSSEQVKIRPGVGLYALFPSLRYSSWLALDELLDNSIQSYLNHRRELFALHSPNYKIRVDINFTGGENPTIKIEDNAAGIFPQDIGRAFTSDKFANLQNKIRESSGRPTRNPSVIPVEMRPSATKIKIILRIPESQAGNLNRIQNEAFLDLNEIIGEREFSVKIDSKNAGRLHFLIISTPDVKDREWIAKLQELASEIGSKFFA